MRIAFAGSGGTGKTTTRDAVNKILRYPVIHEGVRQFLKDNNFSHLRELRNEDTLRMQMELLEGKKKTEGTLTDFIGDRTTLDNAAYAMRWLGRDSSIEDEMGKYVTDCITHSRKYYDIIFIFPWGVIPLEDDGVRSVKPMYQFEIQLLIERLVMMGDGNYRYHFLSATTIEGRVKEILNVISEESAKR